MDRPSTAAEFQLGDYTITPALGRVAGPGGTRRLEPRVMDLLVYLAERPGQVVSRNQIIDAVWRGVAVTDDVISRAVYQIRKGMTHDGQAANIIETIPKRGYRCLVAKDVDAASAHTRGARRPRLAVLPFDSLSAQAGHGHFVDGLHEEILSTLAQRASGLEIISRTSVMRYRREPPASLRELTTQLGASHVVEGSVRREGQDIRVTVQLIDARNDEHLWARDYDRTLGNAIALQGEIAADVTAQLSATLAAAAPLVSQPTRDFGAYEIYLRGRLARQLLNPSRPLSHFVDVEALFAAAIARDPGFALAYAERMRVRAWLVEWNYDASAGQQRAAWDDLASLRRLLPTDDTLLVTMEGLYWSEVEYDPVRALQCYGDTRAAAIADPAFLLSRARLLMRVGRIEEATRTVQDAAALNPGNAVLLNVASLLHLASQDPFEAIRFGTIAVAAGAVPLARIFARFAYSGATSELRDFLDRDGATLESDYRLNLSFRCLLLERRFGDLLDLLAGVRASTVRVGLSHVGLMLAGIGHRPVAELRGWVHLLLGDRQAAAREGSQVTGFVAGAIQVAANRWYLALLSAEGHLFVGDLPAAQAAARAALAMAPRSFDTVAHIEASYMAAWVMAWSGAHDEAVTLLEELTTLSPSLGPAFAVHDPLCALPLAGSARYAALVARLERDMSEIGRQLAGHIAPGGKFP